MNKHYTRRLELQRRHLVPLHTLTGQYPAAEHQLAEHDVCPVGARHAGDLVVVVREIGVVEGVHCVVAWPGHRPGRRHAGVAASVSGSLVPAAAAGPLDLQARTDSCISKDQLLPALPGQQRHVPALHIYPETIFSMHARLQQWIAGSCSQQQHQELCTLCLAAAPHLWNRLSKARLFACLYRVSASCCGFVVQGKFSAAKQRGERESHASCSCSRSKTNRQKCLSL